MVSKKLMWRGPKEYCHTQTFIPYVSLAKLDEELDQLTDKIGLANALSWQMDSYSI